MTHVPSRLLWIGLILGVLMVIQTLRSSWPRAEATHLEPTAIEGQPLLQTKR